MKWLLKIRRSIGEQNIVWDDRVPIKLSARLSLFLRKRKERIEIADSPNWQSHGEKTSIAAEALWDGILRPIGETGVELSFQPTQNVLPVFSSRRDKLALKHSPAAWILFCGIGNRTYGDHRFASSLKISIERQPVFSIQRQNTTVQIRSLVPSIEWISLEGRSSRLEEGEVLTGTEAELLNGTLVWGDHWWRFSPVPHIETLGFTPGFVEDTGLTTILRQVFVGWTVLGLLCLLYAITPMETKPATPLAVKLEPIEEIEIPKALIENTLGEIQLNLAENPLTPENSDPIDQPFTLKLKGASKTTTREIEAGMKSYESELQYCYDMARAQTEELPKTITLKWEIGLTGRVSQSQLISTPETPKKLKECLLKVLDPILFPNKDFLSIKAEYILKF